jgi:hypothetical protein
VARGDETQDRDLDVVVEFEPGSSLFDSADLQDALASLLGRPVDVASIGELKLANALGQRQTEKKALEIIGEAADATNEATPATSTLTSSGRELRGYASCWRIFTTEWIHDRWTIAADDLPAPALALEPLGRRRSAPRKPSARWR